jgi:molybdopterin-guanine dinucleotide biosynthesis protein A
MTLTAVLFVGGESRRMGADKATLVLNGESLWSRQLGVLQELEPEKILISARTKPAWCPQGIEVVLDEPSSRGPLSGLAATLKRIRTTHLLALAVDLPRMSAAHLQKLWNAAQPHCGVVPMSGDKFEPVCAVYPGGEIMIAAMQNALSGDDVSLRGVVRTLVDCGRLRVLPLADSEKEFYLNVNTPEELSKGWFHRG